MRHVLAMTTLLALSNGRLTKIFEVRAPASLNLRTPPVPTLLILVGARARVGITCTHRQPSTQSEQAFRPGLQRVTSRVASIMDSAPLFCRVPRHHILWMLSDDYSVVIKIQLYDLHQCRFVAACRCLTGTMTNRL